MIGPKNEMRVETLLLDLISRLSSQSLRLGRFPTEAESDTDPRWADVTGFAAYLEAHVERLSALKSEAEWLSFVADGAASHEPSIATSCEKLYGLMQGRAEVASFIDGDFRSRGAVLADVTTVAHYHCTDYPSLGRAINTWAEMEASLRRIEGSASRRLFYVDLHSQSEAAGILVWLTHFDDDHLSARDMLNVWKDWSAATRKRSVLVLRRGAESKCYSLSDERVLPLVQPDALVSLFPLQRASAAFVYTTCGSQNEDAAAAPIARRAMLKLAFDRAGMRPHAQSRVQDESGEGEASMPLFSTLDMFLGRRRRSEQVRDQ